MRGERERGGMDQVRVVLGEVVVEKGCTRLYPPPGGV